MPDTSATDTELKPLEDDPGGRPIVTDRYVAWVKKIIAGEDTGWPMVTSEKVTKAVTETFAKRRLPDQPGPTAQAIQHLTDSLNLRKYYGGNVVACVRTPTEVGHLVVLAVGHPNIRLLFARLSEEERAKVILEYPPPSDLAETG
jgi:hypothetical protein